MTCSRAWIITDGTIGNERQALAQRGLLHPLQTASITPARPLRETSRIATLVAEQLAPSSQNRRLIQTGNSMPYDPTQHLKFGITTLYQAMSSVQGTL